MHKQVNAVPGRLVLAVAIGALTFASGAHAADAWSTTKADWAAKGVTVNIGEIAEAGRNVRGGARAVTRAAGQLSLGATLDAEKLWGIGGGTLQLTISDRHGDSIAVDGGLGTLQPVQSIYGRGEIWRLSQFWWEQRWGATQLKIGRLTVGEDFAATLCNFQNLTLCGPAPSQIVSVYIYNFPVSSWGARLRQKVANNLYWNLGIYESNPVNLERDKGFYLGFSGATGTIYASELQWTPKFGGKLAGTWKIGAWYDSSNRNDVVRDTFGNYQAVTGLAYETHAGHTGYSANILQTLKAANPDGSGQLQLVWNLAVAEKETNLIRSKTALGLWYTGLIPGRPKDDIGLGIGRSVINDRVSRQQRVLNAAGLRQGSVQESEVVKELYYSIQAGKHLIVRPNIQYVKNPGGRGDRDNITVLGLKVVSSF